MVLSYVSLYVAKKTKHLSVAKTFSIAVLFHLLYKLSSFLYRFGLAIRQSKAFYCFLSQAHML